jgi:hypothetical protein
MPLKTFGSHALDDRVQTTLRFRSKVRFGSRYQYVIVEV